MEAKLLSRDDFREGVFKRDNHTCVVCGEPAVDAHHILERRLFSDGGYYLENGASLCGICHIEAEKTTLSCDEIRILCGIESLCIPDHYYFDVNYDKWGNIILPNGDRLKGELFYDESVQKILEKGNVLSYFKKYVKYPRTYHLPWSNLLKDDRILKDVNNFIGKRVIGTKKMDGENTTIYNDYIHARSIDSGSHPSRNKVKEIASQFQYLLDDNMRVCGENVYAVHSIKYENLGSYLKCFSIWIDNTCLSWDETIEYSTVLGIDTVDVFYDGIYDEDKIKEAFNKVDDGDEGYVIRLADEFAYSDFRKSIAKFVKPEFRQMVNNSHGHWISKKIEKNEL